jgi:hypothetical protein
MLLADSFLRRAEGAVIEFGLNFTPRETASLKKASANEPDFWLGHYGISFRVENKLLYRHEGDRDNLHRLRTYSTLQSA